METQITPEELAEKVGVFLRAKFLRSPAPDNNVTGWRAKEAEAFGVSEDGFYNWYMGDNCPQAHQIVKMAGRYGAEFADVVLETAGLQTFPIGSDEIDAARLNAELTDIAAGAEALSVQIQKARDGASKPKLREVGK